MDVLMGLTTLNQQPVIIDGINNEGASNQNHSIHSLIKTKDKSFLFDSFISFWFCLKGEKQKVL